MIELLYVGVGAILGAFLRYAITGKPLFANSLPVSVLIVNIVGSFILGLSMAMVQQFGLDQKFVLFIGIGFCGSLTTMSSFAFETVNLFDAGSLLIGGLDIVLNVGSSILAILFGRALILALTAL
jgi:CrcB protein